MKMIYSTLNIKHPVILGSASPRRQFLLKELGLDFTVVTKDIDESYPMEVAVNSVATFLASKKCAAYNTEVLNGNLVIAADTVVILDDKIIGKPNDFDEAVSILQDLSGKKHRVTTGVCIRWDNYSHIIESDTDVYFRDITEQEIKFYINNYSPFDKAGAYGIQDWIGLVAIKRIDGSYHNVMGLPVGELYAFLKSTFNS